jgi:hypothetical protein
MMWLSLIKSMERLNQNFSNKSQNRIRFKFGFCTNFSVLIITFGLDIWLQWIGGVGKLIKNGINMSKIAFS